jgi:carbon-monoxide dehydrogenase iron sulfur subunit
MLTVFVNPERCIGCLQCEFACATEHARSSQPATAILEDPPPRKRVHVQAGVRPNTSFPNKCRHCDPAPCQLVCPTAAIYRDERFDAVLIDASKCIACAMCAMVCPFDVLTFHALANGGSDGRIVAVKCDACVDRLAAGHSPACVEACKVGALQFGELNDLVAAGRRRETAAVLAATTLVEPTPAVPETIAAWRSLGATVNEPGGAR